MGQLIDARRATVLACGMALVMALSSLVLWKSGWLAPAALSSFDVHGANMAVGFGACLLTFAWCAVSPATFRAFAFKVYPPIMLVALALLAAWGDSLEAAVALALLAVVAAGTHILLFAMLFVLAARDIESALFSLLLAWVLSGVLRFAFESIDNGVLRMGLSVVLICLVAFLALMELRRVDPALPLVANDPRNHRESYVHAIGSLWKCVLYGGALAFLGGGIRSLSLQADAMNYINYASVLAGFASPLVIMALWRFRTIRYDIDRLFRVLFPFLVVALCALPFLGTGPFIPAAAVLYALYSFVSLSLQVLCIQVAHDYGIDPVFCFSFQIGTCTGMQFLGFFLGGALAMPALFHVSALSALSLLSLAMLALVLYATRGLSLTGGNEGRAVEFLSLTRMMPETLAEEAEREALEDAVDVGAKVEAAEEATAGSPAAAGDVYEDRISLRCALVGKKYVLSQREVEIMTLFARGHTMASIAKELYISDNTVKTHVRRLYTKLGIHKKQELFTLLNSYVD